MLIGRKTEIDKLIRNLRKAVHTIVYGASGAGKTALLREAANRFSEGAESGPLTVYVADCGDRRRLLEGALAGLGYNAGPFGRANSSKIKRQRVQDLRNALIEQSRIRNICLLLDHLPRLHHRLESLLEILEHHFTLVCAVTAGKSAFDLYYWKFEKIEVKDLPARLALSWIELELGNLGYEGMLKRGISHEILRLTGGNPGAISETLIVIGRQTRLLDDPIRVRRMFIDGRLNRFRRISKH
jgi:hypothetical protein